MTRSKEIEGDSDFVISQPPRGRRASYSPLIMEVRGSGDSFFKSLEAQMKKQQNKATTGIKPEEPNY